MTVYWHLTRHTPRTAPFTRGMLQTAAHHFPTAELPWKDNAHDISCIAPGDYPVRPVKGMRRHKLAVEDVPGREGIRIETFNWPVGHPGDWHHQSRGCIAPGRWPTKWGVADSRLAVTSLIAEAEQVWAEGHHLHLRVRWADANQSTARATGRKERTMLDPFSHEGTVKDIVNHYLPDADRKTADGLIDAVCGTVKAYRDIESGNFADLAKQIEQVGPEIEGAIQNADADAQKAWAWIKARIHHHAKAK